MATTQGDIMVGSVKNMVDRLSKDFSSSKPPMSIHEPRKSHFNKPTNPLVVVTFPYKATQADELNLAAGDILETLEEIEDGWNRGKNIKTGEVGMYPTNFVEAKSTPTNSVAPVMRGGDNHAEPEATKRAPSVVGIALPSFTPKDPVKVEEPKKITHNHEEARIKEMARVKFVYEPQHPDELRLGEIGALIEIIRKDCGDPGWFEGELNGKLGLFPDNFVEIVQVPFGSTSGSPKITSKAEAKTPKAPMLAPVGSNTAPPAVPAKPKPKLTDSNSSLNTIHNSHNITSTPSLPAAKPVPSSNFSDIRSKLNANLNMFTPGDPAPALSKSTIVTGSNGGAGVDDSFSNRPASTYEISSDADKAPSSQQLSHVTKDRPRGPGKRPTSMMVLKKRGSTENLLESQTSQSNAAISLSSLVEIAEKPAATPAAQEIPQQSSHSPSRFAPMKPLKEESKPEDLTKPYFPIYNKEEVKVRTFQPPPSTGSLKVSPVQSVEKETVSRKEYNDVLTRFYVLLKCLFAACCRRSSPSRVGSIEVMDEASILD